VVETESGYEIFVEEFIYATGRGRITVLSLDRAGNLLTSRAILEEDYHLSYPSVFRHDGEFFMVPESSERKSVDLYHCSSFPHDWTRVAGLIVGKGMVDTTLWQRDGLWWLFSTVKRIPGQPGSDDLSIFSSDSLLSGHWTPHPLNPVLLDVRRSRSGGALFEADGILYRPSQDCSVRYGYGLRINRVDLLSSDDYRESEVAFVEPELDQSVLGIHTLSLSKNLMVTDALRWRPAWRGFRSPESASPEALGCESL